MAVRGCGTRVSGGIYLENKGGPNGRPIEYFLVDSPVPVEPDGEAISKRGITLVPDPRIEGLYHVMDWVGSESYPNVADFVEELRRFGLSRRAAITTEFDKLSSGSRILLIHERAIIENPERYYARREEGEVASRPVLEACGDSLPVRVQGKTWCPKDLPEHGEVGTKQAESPVMCASLWWEDVEGMEPVSEEEQALGIRSDMGKREMPGFDYYARSRPVAYRIGEDDVLVEPVYHAGIFAAIPIANIAVVKDLEDPEHEERALRKARRSGLRVELVEE